MSRLRAGLPPHLRPDWRLPSGPLRAITDVPGVRVGHAGVREPDRGVATGVSVVVPDLAAPRAAACHVINGYGKSTGLIQIAELGTIETPIALCSVFAVGAVLDGMTRRHLQQDATVGDLASGRSVNPVVLECNDSFLNDPRARICGDDELARAFELAATGLVEVGTVGAGTGMTTFGLSGGFGTASRVWEVDGETFTLGVALVSNYGRWGDLTIAGTSPQEYDGVPADEEPPGSVVIVVATDARFDAATLRRVCVRAQNGLARTGCLTAHGSGELVVAFSTADPGQHESTPSSRMLNLAFRAIAEAVEDAVLTGLAAASAVTGREGRRLPVLADLYRRLTPMTSRAADDHAE